MSEAWEVDAAQTGEIDRNRKPYLAMRAARCVELSESGVSVKSDTCKVSAQKFAEAAGMSTNTIKSYIAIYDGCVNLHPDEYEKRANMVPLHDYPFPSGEHWTQARLTLKGGAEAGRADEGSTDLDEVIAQYVTDRLACRSAKVGEPPATEVGAALHELEMQIEESLACRDGAMWIAAARTWAISNERGISACAQHLGRERIEQLRAAWMLAIEAGEAKNVRLGDVCELPMMQFPDDWD